MNKLNLQSIKHLLAQSYHSNWLIENFLEKESIGMLFGEPGTYKSFLAMDLAFCVGSGIDWNDKPVVQGDVIYLAGEGFSGIQKRFRALEKKYKRAARNVFISSKPAELIDRDSVNEVLDLVKNNTSNPALIIIDTMHRNFGSGDESSSRDFGIFMKHLDLIKSETSATILFIHHPGHGGKGHSRGSSAIRASLDAEYQVKKQGDGVELICSKMKEFEEPDKLSFKLKQVDVTITTGIVTSAYLEAIGSGLLPASKKKREDRALDILIKLTEAMGEQISNSVRKKLSGTSATKWVKTDEWRQEFYLDVQHELPKKSTQQATFRRCFKNLKDDGKILEKGDYTIVT